jgi:arsenite-transporting ATPase
MRIIFYTGKGGSGKSLISCVTALKLSEIGYKTLIISSDPAYTVSHFVETEINHTPTEITEKLWALQVDPVREFREQYGIIQNYIVSLFKAEALDEVLVDAFATLPVMTEFVSLLKVAEYVESNSYDAIILDTLPSGDSLKSMYLSVLLGFNTQNLINVVAPLANITPLIESVVSLPTPSKEVISENITVIKMLKKVKDSIINPKVTSLRLIADPDALSIQHIKRTFLLANLYGINVDLGILNKAIPEEASAPKEWKHAQERYVAEAETTLSPLPMKKLRFFQDGVKGMKRLSELGRELFGDEDPAQIYFETRPVNMKESERGLEVIIPVPSARTCKEVCEVERVGENLSLVMATDIGNVRNYIPLPKDARTLKLDKAKLLHDELHIYFINKQENKSSKVDE